MSKLAAQLPETIEAGKSTGEFSTKQSTSTAELYLQAMHDGNMKICYCSGTDPQIARGSRRRPW